MALRTKPEWKLKFIFSGMVPDLMLRILKASYYNFELFKLN